jgi:hypothetical protein
MLKANSTLYFKAGAAYLSGKAAFDAGIGTKNFGTVTPMVGVGINRVVNDDFGVGVELSHCFKTDKKFAPIKILGTQIEPRVKISRTTLRVVATCYVKI